ncbi:MAG: phosphoadenylyl-sulfate reductase [Anaerolineaceae bacterium]|nr:phosphoadenylyl-sulfate reductase [Anaerolineaceae bacterium]MDE0329814.1 phosphoadenylyl-sulfate reductase [Anaerolineaceae bacterium]
MQHFQSHVRDELDIWQDELESASPQEILRFAVDQFGEGLVVVTSFQPTGIVTLHMLQQIAPGTKVITLDTGFLFPETHHLIEELTARFDLHLNRIYPQLNPAQQALAHGPELWERNPDLCCHLRKVLPLRNALRDYSAWIAGLRRDQSSRRSGISVIDWDNNNQLLKLSPFATWTSDQIWDWIHRHDLPYNDLHAQGYPSIGCTHCTHPVFEDSAGRSGRWQDFDKTECGLHFRQLPNVEGESRQ